MPIEFDPAEITADLITSGHVVCFPAISQKDNSDTDPDYLKNVYTTLPGANYYMQHAASATARGKTGTYTIHTKGDGGVINMFMCLYPGTKTLANDNLALRLKYFKTCLEQLVSCRTLNTLHFTFPVKVKIGAIDSDLKEYIQSLEDFWATYKLNNTVDLKIIIHHEHSPTKAPIVKPKFKVKVKEAEVKAEMEDAGEGADPVKIKVKEEEGPDVFELDCDQETINEQPLYEVDFVRYIIKQPTPAESDTSISVMQYFPKSPIWNFIVHDERLLKIAREIQLDTVVNDAVYPEPNEIFNAFSYMRDDLKIVLLGQDPYHRKGQAHGLSFSVQQGITIPPSLRNIYKALSNDLPGFTIPKHGHLKGWAEQGVLMLNTALTVAEGNPGSHLNMWEPFTDRLIALLSEHCKGLVFILWGNKPKAKSRLISKSGGHLVLECQHPSPQITNNTFDKDCKHFSQSNAWLKDHKKTPINWQV